MEGLPSNPSTRFFKPWPPDRATPPPATGKAPDANIDNIVNFGSIVKFETGIHWQIFTLLEIVFREIEFFTNWTKLATLELEAF